jgi:cytochrome P450
MEPAFDLKLMFDYPDPYPLFAELRRAMPVMRFETPERKGYTITRYDDCLAVLKDTETFSSRANAEAGRIMGRTILEMDGPEHTRHRALLQAAFSRKEIERLEPLVAGIVDELLERILAEGRVDLVAQLTERFPIQVIAELLGIPRADYPQFQVWAIELIGFPRDLGRGMRAAESVRAYLLPIIAARRLEPRDDMLTRLVHGVVDGRGLTDDEVVSFCRLLLPAGAETTFRLIGNLLVALLTDRDRWERVRAEPALLPSAIEETLRWETSVVMLARQTTRATEIRGVSIAADELISVVIGSGNRDEEHYENPDVFDLDRRPDDHLAFGFGRHHCLGHHLARLETRLCLTSLLERAPHLRLDPDSPPPAITGLAFRSPKVLHVRPRG